MKLPRLALLAGLLIICSCSTALIADNFGGLSPSAGIRQAQQDFAAGKPKIYLSGSIAVFEPGVPENQKALVAKLPRDGSLSGCTNPKAQHSTGFVTAYNQEIVTLLAKAHAH